MDDTFDQHLRNLGVHKLVCLISRRAAGVWSLLPSLAYQNLSDLNGSANIVLIDFGKRNEMFQHLREDPAIVSSKVPLTLDDQEKNIELLNYYENFIGQQSATDRLGADYIAFIRRLNLEGKNLLLCSHEMLRISSNADEKDNIEALRSALIMIAEKYHPKLIYLTFEGQPERPIFDRHLQEDKLMRHCLDICNIILSLVRTDSITKFNEGIDIPSCLAMNPNWESKIVLFLTRHPAGTTLTGELINFVIGHSPFFDLVGQSIESGRIPWVDFKVKKFDQSKNQQIQEYFSGIQQASKFTLDDN